jgi:hypothetical protein
MQAAAAAVAAIAAAPPDCAAGLGVVAAECGSTSFGALVRDVARVCQVGVEVWDVEGGCGGAWAQSLRCAAAGASARVRVCQVR